MRLFAIAKPKTRQYTDPHYTPAGDILRDLLRECRRDKGLTQAELAERLGMSQVLISRGEMGLRKLGPLELRVMCKAMEVDFLEFMRQLDQRLNDHENDPRPPAQPRVEHERRRS